MGKRYEIKSTYEPGTEIKGKPAKFLNFIVLCVLLTFWGLFITISVKSFILYSNNRKLYLEEQEQYKTFLLVEEIERNPGVAWENWSKLWGENGMTWEKLGYSWSNVETEWEERGLKVTWQYMTEIINDSGNYIYYDSFTKRLFDKLKGNIWSEPVNRWGIALGVSIISLLLSIFYWPIVILLKKFLRPKWVTGGGKKIEIHEIDS